MFLKQLFTSLSGRPETMKRRGTPALVIPAALLGRNPASFRSSCSCPFWDTRKP